MTSLRPLLMLALLAWAVVADQGAGVGVLVAIGVKVGWERVAWAWPCQLTPAPHRVLQGPLRRGLQRHQKVSV